MKLFRIVTIPSVSFTFKVQLNVLSCRIYFISGNFSLCIFCSNFTRSFKTFFRFVTYCSTIFTRSFSKFGYNRRRLSVSSFIPIIKIIFIVWILFNSLMRKCIYFIIINIFILILCLLFQIPWSFFNKIWHVLQVIFFLFLILLFCHF